MLFAASKFNNPARSGLSRKVHAKGKVVTLDSFPYIWNAPNSTWWADLFPLVDGLTSMGYNDLGRNAPTWQAYAAQKAMAGANAHKLLIGMPSYFDTWQGDTAAAQAHWFLLAAAGDVGIGIWDAQNQAAAWRTGAVWQRIKAVREEPISARRAQR